jgi:predicted nucleic acid-binding protein
MVARKQKTSIENTMKIIVDTNILFSAMLSQSSHLRQTLNNQELEIFAPNYIFLELFKHKEKLLKLSKQSEAEIYLFLNYLLERIKFISPDVISTQNYRLAYELCKEVDEADTPFVALSLELNAALWSGDKRLKNGLLAKGFQNFFMPTLH